MSKKFAIFFLAFLALTIFLVSDWRYNPFTGKLDYFMGPNDTPAFTAMKLYDTNQSNTLLFKWNENDTADRTLNLLVSAGTRSLTISGDSAINQSLLTTSNAQLKSIAFGTLYDNGSSGNAYTLAWDNGQKQKITLTGAPCVFTFTAPTKGTASFILEVIQGAGGSKTATWPGTVKWPGGVAPVLSTTAGAVDIVSFFYDGTNYYGAANLNFQ